MAELRPTYKHRDSGSFDPEAMLKETIDSHGTSDEGTKEKADFIDEKHPQLVRSASGESELDPKNMCVSWRRSRSHR